MCFRFTCAEERCPQGPVPSTITQKVNAGCLAEPRALLRSDARNRSARSYETGTGRAVMISCPVAGFAAVVTALLSLLFQRTAQTEI